MNLSLWLGHLERMEEAKETDRVQNMEHFQSQLYVKNSRHLCNSACHVVIVVLGDVGQPIAAKVQGCLLVCIGRLNDDYGLF